MTRHERRSASLKKQEVAIRAAFKKAYDRQRAERMAMDARHWKALEPLERKLREIKRAIYTEELAARGITPGVTILQIGWRDRYVVTLDMRNGWPRMHRLTLDGKINKTRKPESLPSVRHSGGLVITGETFQGEIA